MLPYKNAPVTDQQRYVLYGQFGLIASLVVTAVVFRVPLRAPTPTESVVHEVEMVAIEEIAHTEQRAAPPPPLAALPPPVEVADTEVIEEVILPSMDLNVGEAFVPTAPPPPAAAPTAPPPPPEPEPAPEPEVFVVVEQMPELIGGPASIQPVYPDIERMAGVEGRVFLQFVVNEDGSVSDIEVMRGVSPGLDRAAVEALRRARFQPGMQRGRPVKVRFAIPIVFQLRR